jgi:serine/threonine-protein kinase
MIRESKTMNGESKGKLEFPGYVMQEELSRTPRAIIYKARRNLEKDVVALKAFRRATLTEKKFPEQLTRGAETAFILDHPGIVRSLGCVNEGGRLLLVMDFAPGESLAKTLKQKLPVTQARGLKIVLQAAKALHYAASHHIHHGRLHPADIITGADTTHVLGVGLGDRPEHPVWTAQDAYHFEPLIYTATEALPSQPFPETDAGQIAVDVYALGAILFHLLTGAPPFRGVDEESLRQERQLLTQPVEWPAPAKVALPPQTVALVDKMLAPNPAERHTWETLIPALSEALIAVSDTPAAQTASANTVKPSASMGGIIPVPTPALPKQTASGEPEIQWHKPKSRNNDKIFIIVLLSLTSLVFLFALFQIYGFRPAQVEIVPAAPQHPFAPPAPPPAIPPPADATTTVKSAEPVKSADTTITVAPPAITPAKPKDDNATVAARRLEAVHKLLADGQKPSPRLISFLKETAEMAGKDTPVGIHSLLLAGEMEDSLKPATTEKEAPKPEAVAPTPPPAPPAAQADAAADGAQAAAAQQRKQELAATLKAALAKSVKFQHAEALADVEKAAVGSGPEEQKTAEAFAALIRQERDFFLRCRKRLLDEIERSPRKESPLQVYPRKNDPVGDDIVDFDNKGLKIVAKKGPTPGTRVTPWEKVPAVQAFALVQLLSDKKSADEQLGLSVFAFLRNLTNDKDAALELARALDGKDKAEALSGQFKQVNELLGGQ